MALGLALTGIAATGIILPPVIASVLEHLGWRAGYMLLAGTTLVGGLAAFMLIRPQSLGLAVALGTGRNSLILIRSATFWVLGMAIFLVSAGSIGFVSQFQSVIIEKGLPANESAWLISVLAGAVLVSRLVIGRALDGKHPRRVAAVTLIAAVCGTAVFLLPSPNLALVIGGVALLGLSIGGELDLLSFFCARCFGLTGYGSNYGMLSAFFYTGMAAGGLGYGIAHDRLGDYFAPILVTSGLFLLAALLFSLLPDPACVHASPAADADTLLAP